MGLWIDMIQAEHFTSNFHQVWKPLRPVFQGQFPVKKEVFLKCLEMHYRRRKKRGSNFGTSREIEKCTLGEKKKNFPLSNFENRSVVWKGLMKNLRPKISRNFFHSINPGKNPFLFHSSLFFIFCPSDKKKFPLFTSMFVHQEKKENLSQKIIATFVLKAQHPSQD